MEVVSVRSRLIQCGSGQAPSRDRSADSPSHKGVRAEAPAIRILAESRRLFEGNVKSFSTVESICGQQLVKAMWDRGGMRSKNLGTRASHCSFRNTQDPPRQEEFLSFCRRSAYNAGDINTALLCLC
jgi:hypothetical protein